MKICFKCNLKKGLKEFYKHPQMPDGRVNKCKECNKKDVRKNLASKKDFYAEYDRNRIRYNFHYIFLHRYSGMLARTEGRLGKNRRKKYRVTGMPILKSKEFLNWCYEEKNLKIFQKLHSQWLRSNFDKRLRPSIDRIDNEKGYILGNLQWLTVSENCKKHTK